MVPSDACSTEIGYAQAVATILSAFDGYTHASRRSPISDHSNPPPVEQPDHRRGAFRRARDVQAKRLSRIASLIRQRVLIRGEAGLGYVLEGGFDLPPLMLTSDEVEAAVLGLQWVTGHGDLLLARAARDLIAKITATVPETLRRLYWTRAHVTGLENSSGWHRRCPSSRLGPIRSKDRARYPYNENRETDRIIWPIVVG